MNKAVEIPVRPLPRTFQIPHLRWLIVGLVFLATVINFVNRMTLSVLAPAIRASLHLSNLDYAKIGTWFLLAYTISHGLSGRLYDRIGTKRGFSCSIVVWSLAAMAHAFARSLPGLCVCRVFLGLGEAGNWPGAAKVIAEWFPVRERAFAMGIFNSGTSFGAVIAPPLIVAVQLRFGWQTTFIVTGALGFFWLIAWLAFYHPLAVHPWLTPEEKRFIIAGQPPSQTEEESSLDTKTSPSRWADLLRNKQVWAIVLARFLVDPVWWLYILWLPEYLSKARGLSLQQIGLSATIPFVAADAGSLLGGYLSGYLIRKGWSVNWARKTIIVAASLLMPAGIMAAQAKTPLEALGWISLVTFGFQAWINNVQTLPSDLFPQRTMGSVVGLAGVGAGIGSMFLTLTTGWTVDHFSYTPILALSSLLGPAGTLVLLALIGKVGPEK